MSLIRFCTFLILQIIQVYFIKLHDAINTCRRIIEENPLLTLEEIEERCEREANCHIALSMLQEYF